MEKENLHNENLTYLDTQKTPSKRVRKNRPKYNPRVTVRFKEHQYEILKEASKVTGLSIAELVRRSALKNPIKRPHLMHEDARKVLLALGRIGNNLNQIAKKVNSGVFEGWYPELQKNFEELTKWRLWASTFKARQR